MYYFRNGRKYRKGHPQSDFFNKEHFEKEERPKSNNKFYWVMFLVFLVILFLM